MERNLGRDIVDPQKQFEQARYRNNVEVRNEGIGSENQRPFPGPSGNINTNLRSSDYDMTGGARPVLNFSIQTGEEFALEFMRPKVNPRQQFIPVPYNDPNCAPAYMDFRTILGTSHSESCSDISVMNPVEKKDSSVPEKKNNYDSVQSLPQNSFRNNSSCGFQGSSSSGRKLKFLCSFGGRILPRPSDGKLRFVGGDTRIIRISKDISWQELKQKAIEIYNQTQTIKYQLPDEDLDSLVSVSCDEDLQNMMEECSVLEDGGSQKPRMFLFSNSDLEDAHFSLGNGEADSEVQFVVAVNGMDLGWRRNSTALASASNNNLDEFLSLNVERSSSHVPESSTFKSESQHYQGQSQNSNTGPLLVPLQQSYGPRPPNCAAAGENVFPMPVHGLMTQHGGFLVEQVNNAVHVKDVNGSAKEVKMQRENSTRKINESEKSQSSDKEVPLKELKMKRDSSLPKINGTEKNQKSEKEGNVSSNQFDGSLSKHVPREEPPVSGTLLPTKITKIPQEPVQNPMPPDSINDGSELSNHEQTVSRVFHSERIPREQAEMNRLSKSDDSFGSQFLVAQARNDSSQNPELVDKLREGNPVVETQQPATSAKLPLTNSQTIDKINSKTNPNVSEVVVEAKARETVPRQVIPNSAAGNHPSAYLETSRKHVEDSSKRPSDFEWNQVTSKGHNGNNPAGAVSQEVSDVLVDTPENGDILIDINDRFPSDFLSDIFSVAARDSNLSGLTPLHGNGVGYSMNTENHDAKHWSYFRDLAQDEFKRKDVSLMDQDHLGFSSPLTNISEGVSLNYNYPPPKSDGHVDTRIGFNEQASSGIMGHDTMNLHLDYSHSQTKGSERLQHGVVNTKIPESDYEDQRLEHSNANLPLLDLPVEDFDISSVQIIKNEDLEELRELGAGTFGTVYHGKWRGTDVAIKRIKKSCFSGRSSETERLTLDFWREAEILSKLHHPNVVAFYGVVQDGPGGTLATVTEFMVNGSLRHVLLSKERQLDRRKRLIIAMDAAFGMEYLHSKNIVHFDLKCDNLLVNLKDPARPICKVGDFGLSKIKRNTLVTGGVRGTLPWMAPELLNGSSSKVSEKVDVFSFGIVLWEILTGEEPYANMHYGAIIGGIVNNTLRPPVPSYCDAEWKLLMEQCWAPDPVVRPSFTEIARRLRVMSAACPPATKQGTKVIS
ncbi:hypothetical protein ACFE04_005200 [Oxalis oulophora]